MAQLKPSSLPQPLHAQRGPTRWTYLRPAELRRFKNMLFVARTLVEGYYAGRHRSPHRGHSVEFTDYREYCPGDEIQDVDWKALGRTDRLFVKLYEAQTDMVVYTLLDCSASMGCSGIQAASSGGRSGRASRRSRRSGRRNDGKPVSKLEYACYLVAALAFLIVKQSDKIAMGLFRDRLVRYFPPGGTFPHLYGLLGTLETLSADGTTRVAASLRQAYPMFRKRGLLVVVSDFWEDSADLIDALNMYRHRKFEIILFQVLHPDELELPALPSVRFIDAETHAQVTTAVPEVREEYARRLNAHLTSLRTACRARRIDYNLVTTDTDYNAVLERYLQKRSSAGA